MDNLIEERKRMVQSRIEKSFGDGLNLSEEIEKAAHGVYADNAENRRKNRVGQEYGHAAQQKELTGKPAGSNAVEQPTVEDHAGNASDKALQRAAADKNAPEEVRQAAQKELQKRGGNGEDKGGEKGNEENPKTEEQPENSDSDFTEDDAKRFEELNTYIDDPKEKYSDKWYDALKEYRDLRERSFNHELKKDGLLNLDNFKDVKGIGTIHVTKTNDSRGNQIQTPYISITIDKKKDLKNFIKDVNSKLGIELSEDNFEFHPRDRYSSSYYEIAVNPKTKEFNTDSEITKQIKDDHINKQREAEKAERLAKKKQTMNSLKGSDSFTKESVNKLLEDDETKGHAFSYFNYGDDEDCSTEEIEQFDKLKKMGARVSDYFDWKESDEAETYEKKMQAKGYRLFDISTGDGYMWLLIKDKKLSKGVNKSIISDINIADVDEAKAILKGINSDNEYFEKAVYSDTPENRKLGRVGQEYGGKGSRGGKTDEPIGKKQPKTKENIFVKKLSTQFSTRVTPNLSARRLYGKDLKHIVKINCLEQSPSDGDVKGLNEKFGTKVKLDNFKHISLSPWNREGYIIFYNTKTGETAKNIPRNWVDDSVSDEKLSKHSNKSTL